MLVHVLTPDDASAAGRALEVHHQMSGAFVANGATDSSGVCRLGMPLLIGEAYVLIVRATPATAELRHAFLSEKECLIHGDLHTGSVMVPAVESDEEEEGESSGGGAAKVIDGEFAFYGPAAFDVGTFVANIAFSFLSRLLDDDARANSTSR